MLTHALGTAERLECLNQQQQQHAGRPCPPQLWLRAQRWLHRLQPVAEQLSGLAAVPEPSASPSPASPPAPCCHLFPSPPARVETARQIPSKAAAKFADTNMQPDIKYHPAFYRRCGTHKLQLHQRFAASHSLQTTHRRNCCLSCAAATFSDLNNHH